jgi:acyl-homoserine lactone acylase PvdQ
MVSEEGLNAYGAVTWGQFFVYLGFNEHCGWMHTWVRLMQLILYRKFQKDKWVYEYEGVKNGYSKEFQSKKKKRKY